MNRFRFDEGLSKEAVTFFIHARRTSRKDYLAYHRRVATTWVELSASSNAPASMVEVQLELSGQPDLEWCPKPELGPFYISAALLVYEAHLLSSIAADAADAADAAAEEEEAGAGAGAGAAAGARSTTKRRRYT